jgi:hypothetical protein
MALALLPSAGLLPPRARGDCALRHPVGVANLKRGTAALGALLGLRGQGRDNDAAELGRLAYRLAAVSDRAKCG